MCEIEKECLNSKYLPYNKPRRIPSYEMEWREKLKELGDMSQRRFIQIIKFLNGSSIRRSYYSVPIDDRYKMRIRRGKVPRITIHHRSSVESDYETIGSESLQSEIIGLITRKLQEIENEYLNPTYRPSKIIHEKKTRIN